MGLRRSWANAALSRLPPKLLVRAHQFPAHCLKGRTDLPQFVRRDIWNGEIKVMPANPLRTAVQDCDRRPQFQAVEQDSRQSQAARGNDQDSQYLDPVQQLPCTHLLLRRRLQIRHHTIRSDHNTVHRISFCDLCTGAIDSISQQQCCRQTQQRQQEKRAPEPHILQPFHL